MKNSELPITETGLSSREAFIYIATSLATSPLLDGIDKIEKTVILKKVCKEMDLPFISNGDVYQIMHTVELFREKLGLALNKVLDVKTLDIARNNILSNPELVKQSMKLIEDNPELVKKIQKTLSEKWKKKKL